MKNYLLGIDLGTTKVKAGLYDFAGNAVADAECGTYQIISERANWAEQDANLWWRDTVQVIRSVLEKIHNRSEEIACVSVSSQGMAMLPLDSDGVPLCRAHIWMDRRAVEETKMIEESLGRDYVKKHFGAYADPYYQITNILWFKRHCPELYAKTRHIVKANTYLNFKLTGEYAIDETQAIMSLCYDIHSKDWSDRMADVLNIPLKELLPPVYGADHIMGEITSEAHEETGLAVGTPVVVSSVDTALALLEVGITRQGDAAEITGTSSNNLFASQHMPSEYSPMLWFKPLVETKAVPHLLFAPTNTTGEALRWARNILGYSMEQAPDGTSVYTMIDKMIKSAGCGSGGLFFYPYLLGERAPLWSNSMRGMYIGASLKTTQGDMLRAVYEGTSFALKEICMEAKAEGAEPKRFCVSGGCARSDIWMKIKASVLGMPIQVMKDSGGAPKGNAVLAGYSVGIFRDFTGTVEQMRQIDRIVEPDPEWTRRYEELFPVFLSIRKHVAGDLEALASICGRYEADY